MDGLFSVEAWEKVWIFRETFLLGITNTLKMAFFALLISLILGIIFGLMATSGKKILEVISRVYVELIQNTPLILQLCFVYYGFAFSGRSLGILVTGFLALGVYHGAYMAEVIRAGIGAIHEGQFEAADSQGFTYVQKMGYIILPQSIKIILPPMVNQVVNLIKNTSCLYIIGGSDLISNTYSFVTGASTGGAYGPAYLVCGLIFFIVCFPLSTLASIWENSLKKRDMRTITVEATIVTEGTVGK
jgi:putative glutamine transport system permease protein